MSLLREALRELSSALDHRWALVGVLAASARAEPRLTRDIDVAVAVESDSDAEAIVSGLIGQGYEIVATVEQDRHIVLPPHDCDRRERTGEASS